MYLIANWVGVELNMVRYSTVDVDVVVPPTVPIIDSWVTKGRKNSEQNEDALNIIDAGLSLSQTLIIL
jgi:hypothetical protein